MLKKYYCPNCKASFNRKKPPASCPIDSFHRVIIERGESGRTARVFDNGENITRNFALVEYEGGFNVNPTGVIIFPFKYPMRSDDFTRLVKACAAYGGSP